MNIAHCLDAAASEMRRGWTILGAGLLGNMVGVNVLIPFTLSAFLVPLQHAFGWSRTEISLGSTIVTLGTAAGVVLVGLMMRRVAIRILIASGLLAGALGFWALARLEGSIASFWSILGVVSVLAGGCSPATLTRLVVGGFVRRRGLALGITLLGPGLVAALAPPLLMPLIGAHGWRSGYVALGILSLMALPLMLLLLAMNRHQPAPESVPKPPVPALAKTPNLLPVLAAAFFCVALATGGVVVHLPAMLTDAGFRPQAIAELAGLLGLCLIVSRLLTGWLADRFFAPHVATLQMSIGALGFCLLGLAGHAVLPLAVIFAGLSLGAEMDLVSYLASRYFPLRGYGGVFGLLYAAFQIGVAISPPAYGAIFDNFHGYAPAFLGAGACLGLAAMAFYRLPAFPGGAA